MISVFLLTFLSFCVSILDVTVCPLSAIYMGLLLYAYLIIEFMSHSKHNQVTTLTEVQLSAVVMCRKQAATTTSASVPMAVYRKYFPMLLPTLQLE